ncbi:MAG: FGGY-family carbohydrate kinase [Spirochaetes bacterium]|nr:FGGY-family carbohydrate kinase [Spirochaetota bacterium]
MEKHLLAIDCGTQSVRALLFDVNGNLIKKQKIEYQPYVSDKPGWAEQDPNIFWENLCIACQQLKVQNPREFQAIAGVGITAQRDSMINLDENGNPLRNAIIWLDQRKAQPVYQPKGVMKLFYKAIGMDEAILKTQMDGKVNWIRENQKEIWEKTYKYVQVSGFLHARLTGKFIDSVASQIGHIPFNYKKCTWSKPGRELNARVFPVEHEKLPELVKPSAIIGNITIEAARVTGITEGTPVIACGSDKGCETIGMGVIDQNMASLSFGTTATVQTTSHYYFEPLRFMPAYPAPIPDHFNPEVEIFRGYWMITWFKEEFAHQEVDEAKKKGITPEMVLNKLLEKIPAGSLGLIVQPYWSPGLKNPSAKGTIIGFGDVHKRGHLYKAVIEGLGYALLDGLHQIEKRGRQQVQRLAVSGGASQSTEICQISADIFNKPLVKGKTYETAGLGAAIITAVGLGIYPDFPQAIKNMVVYDQYFYPNPQNVQIYRDLYNRVYRKLYRSVSHHYEEIREITGYPEKV